MQLRNADEDPTSCDVVGVTICNFKLWSEKDKTGRFKAPMLSRWRMQEQHSKEIGLSQILGLQPAIRAAGGLAILAPRTGRERPARAGAVARPPHGYDASVRPCLAR